MRTLFRYWLVALMSFSVGLVQAGEPAGRSNSSPSPLRESSGWIPLLEFEGNQTFSATQIQEGLEKNYDLALAMRTANPADDRAPLIASAVKGAYLRAGFPDVKVDARAESSPGAVHIRIVEGRRYSIGSVRISGTKQVSPETLARRLTEPWYPLDAIPLTFTGPDGKEKSVWVKNEQFECKPGKPRWEPGKPAPFDPVTLEEVRERLEEVFQIQGFFSPRFEVAVEPDRERATADLVVTVENEGDSAVVKEVVVRGADRFSREALLDYLGVKPGMRYTGRTDAELERRLWESGRYVRQDVSATFMEGGVTGSDGPVEIPPLPGDDETGESQEESVPSHRVRLLIQVTENPFAPEFGAALTEIDQALLNVSRWMEQWSLSASEEELALDLAMDLSRLRRPEKNVAAYELFLRVSGGVDRAAVLDLSFGRKGASPSFQQTCAFTPQETVFLSSRSTRRYESRFPATSQLILNVTNLPDRNPGQAPTESLLNIGFGLKSLNGKNSNPFRLRLLLAPAVAFKLKTLEGTRCELVDGSLLLESAVLQMRFDARSGALQRLRVQNTEFGITIDARFEPGIVARALDEFARLRTELPGAGPEAPRSDSILRYLSVAVAECMAEVSSDDHRPTLAVLAKLVERWHPPTPEQLLSWFRGSETDGSDFFVVPAPACECNVDGSSASWNSSTSGQFLSIVRSILPRQGKSHEIARDSLLAFPDRSRETLLMETIYLKTHRDDCGPITTLAQMALTYWDPQATTALARRGYLRMSEDHFLKDCQLLLSGDGWFSEFLLSVLTSVRDLSPEEIRALTQLCTDEKLRDALAGALIDWKKTPDTPPIVALWDCIPPLWNACARTGLSNVFVAIAHRQAEATKSILQMSDDPGEARTFFGLDKARSIDFWKKEGVEVEEESDEEFQGEVE